MIKKHKLALTLFLTLSSLCFYPKVYAHGPDCEFVGYVGKDGEVYQPGGDDGGGGGGGGGGGCSVGRTVTCGIRQERTEEHVYLNNDVYDEEYNFIGEALLINRDIRVVSGRFVGLDVYEEYKKTFYVSINPSCVQGVYYYEKVGEHTEVWTCPDGTDSQGNTTYTTCEEIVSDYGNVLHCEPCSVSISECRGEAEAKLDQLVHSVKPHQSYSALINDENDINNPIYEIDHNEEYDDEDFGHPEPSDRENRLVWQTYTKAYTYNLEAAWLDPKTGEVKHMKINNEPEKYTIEVKPHETKWRYSKEVPLSQYFVPLNAKSTDVFGYYLKPTRGLERTYSPSLCIEMVNRYNVRSSDKEFWGDFIYARDGNPLYDVAKTAKEARERIQSDGGCHLGLIILFRIEQNFYGEPKKRNTGINSLLSGYYYKPIDYTNPFPNGLNSNSFWYNIYNTNNNKITVTDANNETTVTNLLDSFSKVTYATNTDYNEKRIREYNKLTGNHNNDDVKMYPSFQNITLSGISNFISENYGISRIECNSVYALGCGPANADWAECKHKTEVCGT